MDYPCFAAAFLILQLLVGSPSAQAQDPAPTPEVTTQEPPKEEPPKKGKKKKKETPVTPDPTAEAAPNLQDQELPKKKAKIEIAAPDISGYVQFYYKRRFEQSGDNTTEPDVFRFGRVKIQISGEVVPDVKYVVEIDPRSPEIEGVMRDCYVQWECVPDQRLRFGQMKTPFGWENRQSSSELYTVNRTEVGETFGRGRTLRDIGVGLFGRVPLGDGWRLEDEFTYTNGAGLGAQEDDDHRKNYFGRLGARKKMESVTVSWGVSGARGTMIEPADPGPPPVPALTLDFKRWGADVAVETDYLLAVLEFARGQAKASIPGEGGGANAWYFLLVGKTSSNLGPLLRYDEFDGDYARWTVGEWYGAPKDTLRFIGTFDWVDEDALRHDDRLLLWMQVRF